MSAIEATVDAYRADGDDGPETNLHSGEVHDGGTANHFSAPGDDSPPLPGDYACAVELEGKADSLSAVGYSDDTPREAEAGEKRIYARDPDGAVVSSQHMEGDKTVTIAQVGGSSVTLAADGLVTVAGPSGATVTIATDGAIKLDGPAGFVEIDAAGAIKLSGTEVAMKVGQALGSFLQTLHAGVTAWVVVPQDGGAALKTALGAWIAQTPPGP